MLGAPRAPPLGPLPHPGHLPQPWPSNLARPRRLRRPSPHPRRTLKAIPWSAAHTLQSRAHISSPPPTLPWLARWPPPPRPWLSPLARPLLAHCRHARARPCRSPSRRATSAPPSPSTSPPAPRTRYSRWTAAAAPARAIRSPCRALRLAPPSRRPKSSASQRQCRCAPRGSAAAPLSAAPPATPLPPPLRHRHRRGVGARGGLARAAPREARPLHL